MLLNREEMVEGKIAGVGEKGVYNGPDLIDRYRAVYHLLPHFSSCLLEDQLQYCLVSFIFSWFVNESEDHLVDMTCCVLEAAKHQILKTPENAVKVWEC